MTKKEKAKPARLPIVSAAIGKINVDLSDANAVCEKLEEGLRFEKIR